jgi:hypothetical protein
MVHRCANSSVEQICPVAGRLSGEVDGTVSDQPQRRVRRWPVCTWRLAFQLLCNRGLGTGGEVHD